jgi:hypothetical protein
MFATGSYRPRWRVNMTPLPRVSGNQYLHRKSDAYRDAVRRKIAAYHRHIQLGLIAQGLLQILAATQPQLVWRSFGSWIPRAMNPYQFVLGIVLGLYIGFARLNQLRFIARDPILTGILKVAKLPVQSTFWRFVNALHGSVARQILAIMGTLRERVWAAANVKLQVVTIDTDTTVHTLYGEQMGGRKGYNPKNKGKKSYQPILTFIAETREYVWGELRNGDRPSGKQIGDHIRKVCAALPPGVKQIYGRVDSGFYCWEAVEAYEECKAWFVISARKTSRLSRAALPSRSRMRNRGLRRGLGQAR